MTTITKNFNTDLNFWEINPIFKTIKLFKELYDKDKSKKKDNSSHIMWAIVLLVDPNEANPWRNLNDEEKRYLIADEYLEDPKFKWEDYSDHIKEYENRCLTIAEKELIRFEKLLVQRGELIHKEGYKDISTGLEVDKMVANNIKIMEQYRIIKDMLAQEQMEGRLRGGAKKSANERGDI